MIQSPSEYLHNLYLRRFGHWRRNDKMEMVLVIKGEEFTEAELNRLFPIAEKIRIPDRKWKGENVDGTKF